VLREEIRDVAMGFREDEWTAKSAAHRFLCHPPGGRFTQPWFSNSIMVTPRPWRHRPFQAS